MNRFIAAAFAAFLLLLIVAPTPAQAFTTTACANGETGTCRLAACGSDVQAAIDASAAGGAGYISPTSFAGDGVYVQNCSSTSTSLSWTDKNINLRGVNDCALDAAGLPTSCGTNLSGSFTIKVTDVGGRKAAFRISHMVYDAPGGVFINYNGSNPHSAQAIAGYFRVDHILQARGCGANGLQHYGVVFGLYDHLNVTMPQCGNPYIEQSEYLNNEYGVAPTKFLGEWSALAYTPRGTVNNVYVEDSKFTLTGTTGITPLSDSESGPGHLVFRYNTVTSAGTYYYFYAHWNRGSEWDGAWREFYNNKMTCSGGCGGGWPFRLQSGTGVIYNNQISGWSDNTVHVDEYRGDGSETGTPMASCNGTRAWDNNGGDASAPGWPCASQIGVGCLTLGGCSRGGQDNIPLILWNNGTQATCATGGACTNSVTVSSASGNWVKSTAHTASVSKFNGAVDYCHGLSSKPSSCGTYTNNYTPLTYPHPLQGTGIGTVLPPPTNLHITRAPDWADLILASTANRFLNAGADPL